jgi:isoquinoline 1-oxidoreductase beta subunit
VQVPSGVAVLGDHSWAVIKGRDALSVAWDNSAAENRSSPEMMAEYRKQAEGAGIEAMARGDAAEALAKADKVHDFEFTFPFLAQAPLEPLNGVIEWNGNAARLWAGCQLHTLDQWAVAEVLGISRDSVSIETPYTGSSFGRRAYSNSDWIRELAEVAKVSKLGRPIQVFWTREDDLAGGVYRPMALHKAKVAMGKDGLIAGWSHKVVCKSLVKGTPWEPALQKSGADRGSIGGVTELDYAIPNMTVQSYNAITPIPVGFWRSVGDSHNVFASETIMDVLANESGADPIEFRIKHLMGRDRNEIPIRVLKHVADLADWTRSPDDGVGRGVAFSRDHIFRKSTHVAVIAEVASENGETIVQRIFVAVDCGAPINPNVIKTQVESSVVFALSTVLRNEITHHRGEVEQHNFDEYEPARMAETPEIVVSILPSDEQPVGIGEAAVAPVAPAIANAMANLTGQRVFDLPLRSL